MNSPQTSATKSSAPDSIVPSQIQSVSDLAVGDQVMTMQWGELIGPFTVVAVTGARSANHVILQSEHGVRFEQYVPWSVWK